MSKQNKWQEAYELVCLAKSDRVAVQDFEEACKLRDAADILKRMVALGNEYRVPLRPNIDMRPVLSPPGTDELVLCLTWSPADVETDVWLRRQVADSVARSIALGVPATARMLLLHGAEAAAVRDAYLLAREAAKNLQEALRNAP